MPLAPTPKNPIHHLDSHFLTYVLIVSSHLNLFFSFKIPHEKAYWIQSAKCTFDASLFALPPIINNLSELQTMNHYLHSFLQTPPISSFIGINICHSTVLEHSLPICFS